jgi:3-oxoacyl-[acyl-carrier-protein] synthase II
MDLRRVVVTGLGALTPLGNDPQSFWKGMCEGKSGAAPITKFDATNFKTRFACELKDFDPSDVLNKKDVRKLDPYAQYAMVCADQAVVDSGILEKDFDPDRVGVVWASGIGGLTTFQQEVTGFNQNNGVPRFNPFFIPKMIADIGAGQISIRFGFRGPNYATVSACASSTNAVVNSFNHIRMGYADAMVAGGSEAAVVEAGMGGFNAMKALSERNDSPETASRPFDKDRDGFVLGEGAGALILEEYERAKKRGAKIYAEVVGGGMTADAYHITAPHPDGSGALNVMKNALKDANLNPEDIDYINVHGTSTPLGDISEVKAIQTVFGDHAYDLNISSTKSMTGHLLGAAGAVESIACIMAINHDIVPPTINHFTDDEAFDTRLNFTFNQVQEKEVRAALNNTFGFGGHNFSAIFKKV